MKDFFNNKFNWVFFGIIVLFVLLRIPSLFEPKWYGDEGIYAAIANEMSHGEALYRDTWDHKPPAIYLIYTFFDFFGSANLVLIKLLNIIVGLGTLLVIKKIAEKYFSPKISLAVIFLFALLAGSTILEGNIANAENFFMFFTALGFWTYLSQENTKGKVMTGVWFSLALLFKLHPLFEFFALLFFVFVVALREKYKIKEIFMEYVYILLPFAAIQLVFLGIFGAIGGFQEYFFTNIVYNLGYTSFEETTTQTNVLSPNSQLFRAGVTTALFLLFGVLYYLKKISKIALVLGLWLVGGLFAARLSARPYPHYFLQIVPALVLLAGLFMYIFRTAKKTYIKIALPIALIIVSVVGFFSYFPTDQKIEPISSTDWRVEYYTGFVKLASGQIDRDGFKSELDEKTNSFYELAEFVESETETERPKVFLWGNSPWFYDIANVNNVNRYVVDFHIGIDPDRRAELMRDLEIEKPEFIIQEEGTQLFESGETGLLPEGTRGLGQLLNEDYNLIGINIGGRYMVYGRK